MGINYCEQFTPLTIMGYISLVLRPFERRRKDLVGTACACAKFTDVFLV